MAASVATPRRLCQVARWGRSETFLLAIMKPTPVVAATRTRAWRNQCRRTLPLRDLKQKVFPSAEKRRMPSVMHRQYLGEARREVSTLKHTRCVAVCKDTVFLNTIYPDKEAWSLVVYLGCECVHFVGGASDQMTKVHGRHRSF